jgi:beta-lactamase superfamily II metal-dependent hydrolase
MKKHRVVLVVLFLLLYSFAFAETGKLQIHFMDVGQGDAALLVSPLGETVLFDNGIPGHCDLPISYLQQLGITTIDYHVASHYHDDHIGCTSKVLAAYPLNKAAYDRGGTNPSGIFEQYATAVGSKRREAVVGNKITLDAASANPVVVEFVASNGNGIPAKNENDLSLVSVIRFGKFDAVMGGDLSGYKTTSYEDIESSVASKVGQVEVYKVHHHCSNFSTNSTWLSTVNPKVGIISASGTMGRNHGHPTEECLERLHKAGVRTYWTETGGGATPDPKWDTIAGNIIVEAEPTSETFTVSYNSRTDSVPVWGAVGGLGLETSYAWSKKSSVYHYSNCKYVANISPNNLERSSQPPDGKRLHEECPIR